MNYDFKLVFDALSQLVGWEQSKNPNLPTGYSANPDVTPPIDAWFDTPLSNQFYNGVHPLVTLFNIYNSVNSSPNALTDTEFTDVLLGYNKLALQAVLSKLAVKKKIARETKTLLEQGDIYKGLASFNDVEPNKGSFVGWLVELGASEDYLLTFHNLSFQFNSAFVGLPIYLYHSSKKEAITSFSLNYTSNFNTEITQLDDTWKLRNSNETYGNTGYYFLGYFQSDLEALGAEALNRTVLNFSLHDVCYSCGDKWSFNRFLSYTKHFRLCAVSIDSQYLNGVELPDLGEGMKNITKESNKTFGMNANVSVVSDITNFLIKYSYLLVTPLQWQMAYNVVNELAYSLRANSISDDLLQMSRAEMLDKDSVIKNNLEEALNAFDYDMSGQNSPSMPSKQAKFKFLTH